MYGFIRVIIHLFKRTLVYVNPKTVSNEEGIIVNEKNDSTPHGAYILVIHLEEKVRYILMP